MKRNLKLILAALVAVPFVAKADMAAPVYRKMEVIITSDKDIVCKSYVESEPSKIYKKGDIAEVYYVKYGDDGGEYWIDNCEVSEKDFKLRNEEVSPTDKDITKRKEVADAVVTYNGGLDVRKGPGVLYDIVGHIDKGATFKYQYVYADEEGYINSVYLETENVKGWIDLIDEKNNSTIKEVYTGNYKLIAMKDISSNGVKIPANTLINIKYNGAPHIKNALYSIGEYNGKELNLYDEDGIRLYNDVKYMGTIELTEDVGIYKNAGNKGNKLSTLPKGTKANMISSINDDINFEDGESESLYVEYNGVKGWIVINNKNISDGDGIYYYEREDEFYDFDDTSSDVTDDKKDDKDNKDKKEEKKTGLTTNNFIWAGIGAAIGAACGAICLLIKNNSKKNQ